MRACASNAQPPDVQRTLNVYGSDAVVREDWGVENSPARKVGAYLRYTHTHGLSSISID